MKYYNDLYLIGFQDPATPIMEGIIDLHNYIFFYLILILFFISSILINIIIYFFVKLYYNSDNNILKYRYEILKVNKVTHGTVIEIIWTLLPTVILILIVVPSFALLYAIDEIIPAAYVIKVIGHQWYWAYEYPVSNSLMNNKFKFDSYLIHQTELKLGQRRLLAVDNSVVVPHNKHIRFIITSSDVLHSWAVPSLGIKMDAVPGRLNQASAFIKRTGNFYGQCSEICGVNHGFMPIVVQAVSEKDFLNWANLKKHVA